MTGFYPGPWLYRPDEFDDWGTVRAAPDEQGRMWHICQARDPRVHGEEQLNAHRRAGTDPWEANARLIASAPEMYAALVKFAEHMEADTFAFGDNPSDCYELARATIRKVDGEQS